ncbi:hypothetical protein D3C85_1514480 [compost metagenome]
MFPFRGPSRVSNTLVLQSLLDALHTFLLIQTSHSCHQLDEHVVNHAHDLASDALVINHLVRRGQVCNYKTQALGLDSGFQGGPILLRQSGQSVHGLHYQHFSWLSDFQQPHQLRAVQLRTADVLCIYANYRKLVIYSERFQQ